MNPDVVARVNDAMAVPPDHPLRHPHAVGVVIVVRAVMDDHDGRRIGSGRSDSKQERTEEK